MADDNGKVTLAIIKEQLNAMAKKQEEMHVEIKAVNKMLVDPDKGLFTRVKANTDFRRIASASLWVLYAAVITGGVKLIFFP